MLVVTVAAGIACYWSARLAIADLLQQRPETTALTSAIALAPGNEDYLRRAGELADDTGGDGSLSYRTALRVDPYASQDWMRLAFDAERHGQYQKAEHDLLQAASVNRLFEPRWALANFYFRREETDKALYWIRQSFLVEQGDLTAAFRLCWAISADPARILRGAIPNRPAVLEQYQGFLVKTQPAKR